VCHGFVAIKGIICRGEEGVFVGFIFDVENIEFVPVCIDDMLYKGGGRVLQDNAIKLVEVLSTCPFRKMVFREKGGELMEKVLKCGNLVPLKSKPVGSDHHDEAVTNSPRTNDCSFH